MNKSVLAVAVAGLFAAPAVLAQTSNVEVYGRLVVGVDQYEAKGATTPTNDFDGRIRVFDNSSRVGFRGTEDLGGGLKAIFQIESGVNVDSGTGNGQNGLTNASSGFWASRDSFVGLDTAAGRVTFGRQTIYRLNGPTAQFGGLYINTEVPWTDGLNLGRITGGAGLPGRTSNVVMYTTPNFGGINGSLSYSPQGEAVQNVGTGTADTDGRIYAVELRGTFGPIYASIHYADVQGNTNAANQQLKAKGYRGGVSWAYMPGARIGAIYTRVENGNETGAAVLGVGTGDEVDQDAWVVNWEHTFGNVQLLAQFGQLLKMKGCDDTLSAAGACDETEAKAWMVGARYLLSKRTWLFASWNEVDNDSNQFSDYTGASQTSVQPGINPLGADPRIIAVGVFHQF